MHAVSDEVNTVFRHIRDEIRKVESALMLSFAVEVKQFGVLGVTSFFHRLQLSSSMTFTAKCLCNINARIRLWYSLHAQC